MRNILSTPKVIRLAIAAASTLAYATLTPQPLLAAPTITLKASFDRSGNGANPYATLMPAVNGKFYGTTTQGGTYNKGTIFEFDPISGGLTLKASFTGSGTGGNGSHPNQLTPTGSGTFYGTAGAGGAGDYGSIFEFDPISGGLTLKASFTGSGTANGNNPNGLTQWGGNGKFYGFTTFGGTDSVGNIYEFDPNNSTITSNYSFSWATGAYPQAPLALASNGKLYGSTQWLQVAPSSFQPSIYEFDPSNNNFTTKALLNPGSGPGSPTVMGLTPTGNGKFYGTAGQGGANDYGFIFEFDPTSGGITLIASFDGSNGITPREGLIQASNGKFYGTTHMGGANGFGAIYEFDPNSGDITLMASFDGYGNGANPYAGLTPAGNGKFYGLTYSGGAHDLGAIYEFDPAPPVPGPLPLLGAGAAFGWSRQLRRRVRRQQPRLRVLA